jgi:hypothetical protein
MCPVCVGAALTYAAGASSAGGVMALLLRPLRKLRRARTQAHREGS